MNEIERAIQAIEDMRDVGASRLKNEAQTPDDRKAIYVGYDDLTALNFALDALREKLDQNRQKEALAPMTAEIAAKLGGGGEGGCGVRNNGRGGMQMSGVSYSIICPKCGKPAARKESCLWKWKYMHFTKNGVVWHEEPEEPKEEADPKERAE